jgi:uncharacterized DUF497 family protein
MKIVWDEPKRRANLEKHGLDFADLDEVFFADALIFNTGRAKRWMGIGVNQNGLIVVVFARLGREGVSVISMRVASKKERSLYREKLKEEG